MNSTIDSNIKDSLNSFLQGRECLRYLCNGLNKLDKEYGFKYNPQERREIIFNVLDINYIPLEETFDPKKLFIIKKLLPEMDFREAASIADKVLSPDYTPFPN